MLRNSESTYGLVAVMLHWGVAGLVVGLFALGLWMVELTYYDAWYRRAPFIHKGLGVTLVALMALRLLWRLSGPAPAPLSSHAPWERRLARLTHLLLYALPVALGFSGYLISTADGRPLEVFGLLEIPAAVTGVPNQADIAGAIHRYLAYALIGLAGLHALAALKHHFLDRDGTLTRMLGRGRRP